MPVCEPFNISTSDLNSRLVVEPPFLRCADSERFKAFSATLPLSDAEHLVNDRLSLLVATVTSISSKVILLSVAIIRLTRFCVAQMTQRMKVTLFVTVIFDV